MKKLLNETENFFYPLEVNEDLDENISKYNENFKKLLKLKKRSISTKEKVKIIDQAIQIHSTGNLILDDYVLSICLELIEKSEFRCKYVGYFGLNNLMEYDGKQTYKKYITKIFSMMKSQLKIDLNSKNVEETILALEFIGNKFNNFDKKEDFFFYIEDEMYDEWEKMINKMYFISVSHETDLSIKKKSILALSSVLKFFPDLIQKNGNWLPKIFFHFEEKRKNIEFSVCVLVKTMMWKRKKYINFLIVLISKKILELVKLYFSDYQKIENSFFFEWNVKQFLSLIEYCLSFSEESSENFLLEIDDLTLKILKSTIDLLINCMIKNLLTKNIQNTSISLLFKILYLDFFLDSSWKNNKMTINLSLKNLKSNDLNINYLVIDFLIKIVSNLTVQNIFFLKILNENLQCLFSLLKINDATIQKVVIALIFHIADSKTYENYINKLINCYYLIDDSLKVDLSIKIMSSVEKHVYGTLKYVKIIMNFFLLETKTDESKKFLYSDEVWINMLHMIQYNRNIHFDTCRYLISILHNTLESIQERKEKKISFEFYKMIFFIIGEYGESLKEDNYDYISEIILILNKFYSMFSANIKYTLLSTFIKLHFKFSEKIDKNMVLEKLKLELNSPDLQIRTLSNEYYELLKKNLLSMLFFLKEKKKILHENDIGTKSSQDFKSFVTTIFSNVKKRSNFTSFRLSSDYLESLSINESKSSQLVKKTEYLDYSLTSNWHLGYLNLIKYNTGSFFENELIEINFNITKKCHIIYLNFTINNKSFEDTINPITFLNILSLKPVSKFKNPSFSLGLIKLPTSNLKQTTSFSIMIKFLNIFKEVHDYLISISFNCGNSFSVLNLKIPIFFLKSMNDPTKDIQTGSEKHWFNVFNFSMKAKYESSFIMDFKNKKNICFIKKALIDLGFNEIKIRDFSQSENILTFCGALHSLNEKFLLITNITEYDTNRYIFVIRSLNEKIPEILSETVKKILYIYL